MESSNTLLSVTRLLWDSFYNTKGRQKVFHKDPANVLKRANYLKYFFQYEHDKRPFVFVDESWLNKNMVPTRYWSDGTQECEPDVPPGKGERWIIIGAGGKQGWIRESIKLWKEMCSLP